MPKKSQRFIPIVPYIEGAFICDHPDGGYDLIRLQPHQKRILEAAFTPNADGRLPYRTVIISTIKKSGKSTLEAAIASWFAFSGISPPGGEIYIVANDKSQAEQRVFNMLRQSIERSPILLNQCRDGQVLLSGVETLDGTKIRPIACDYAGEAGANPVLSCWDELWGNTTVSGLRLWEEFTPVPTRRISMRLVVTYAGFEGKGVLWSLYESAMRGRRLWDDLPVWINDEQSSFCYWDTGAEARRMPWQVGPVAEQYYREQKAMLSRSNWLRLHENQWAAGEEGLNMLDWDACVSLSDQNHFDYAPPIEDRKITLAVGIDAAYKFDRASVMTVFKRKGMFWRGPGRWWPTGEGFSLDSIEEYLIDLRKHFRIGPVYYDPYQMVHLAGQLRKRGFRMIEFPQSTNNHHVQGNMLVQALQYRKLVLSPADCDGGSSGLRDQAASASVVTTAKGIKLEKSEKNAKIDSIVALAMALVAADTLPDYEDIREQIMIFDPLGPRQEYA